MSRFLENVWGVLHELAPWLLVGCLVAGIIYVLIPARFLQRHLGSGFSSVFKAVLLGVPMPLCSCGVIPAAIGIKKQGASDGASMGFLISTPQTGVDSLLVSASFLSWPFAIFKLLSAFILGVIGGGISHYFSSGEVSEESVERSSSDKKTWRDIYEFAINDLLYMIWGWLVIGVLLSAAITTWVPKQFIADWGNQSLIYSLCFVLLISVPLYVCATSSVPIAAALVHAGMPPSAALVFLIAGPATNMATIGAVFRAFGKRHLIVYLGTVILGSLSLAFAFDFVIDVSPIVHHHDHGSFSSIFVYLLLLFFFLFALKDLKSLTKKYLGGQEGLNELELFVSGMTCKGCVNKLTRILLAIDGVDKVDITLENGRVLIFGDALNRKKLTQVVNESGFKVQDPKK